MTAEEQGLYQSNVASRAQDLPPIFFALVIATGVLAGFGAMAMMGTLRAVQHVAFGYSHGEFVTAVGSHSDLRRVVVLGVAGLVTGFGLWIMKRHFGGTGGEPTSVVWEREGDLSPIRTLISGALSELSVGMGASLGREAAPQRCGAAAAAFLARHFKLLPEHRRLLIACGAGAGLAAVYNVPLAGALFVAEIYLDSIELRTMIPALLATGIATAVAWISLPAHSLYHLPVLPAPGLSVVVFAVVAGPLIGLSSAAFVKGIAWASAHRPSGLALIFEPLIVFGLLGLVSTRYPLLLGNGTDLAQFALTGTGALWLLFSLTVLKPVATALCLRSGATGGLFTPALSFGAIFGAFAGHLWIMAWPGSPSPAYAAIAAGAMLGAAAEAPITGVAFILELAPGSLNMVVPILLAVIGATIISRKMDIRSIYSARLSPEPREIRHARR